MTIKLEKINPLGERCLIKPYEAATQTKSGVVRENSSNTSSAKTAGTVIRKGDKSRFSVGDMVLFRRYSVDDLKYITPEGEQTATLVDDENVLALVEQD